jgi:hypothetical protein
VEVSELAELARERSVDVLILAEFGGTSVALLEQLNLEGHARFHLPVNHSPRLTFVVASPSNRFVSLHDSSSVAVRHFRPPIGEDILIVALHLPSKMYLTSDDQALLATRTTQLIDRFESRIGHTRTIVIGDFNMNPFEPGVVGSEGFHAVMAQSIAAKGDRTVVGEKRRFFYNPMWSLLGDNTPGPPGTYYYPSSSPITYFWNTFDQVLLRPQLAKNFEREDITVIAKVGRRSLLTASGIPDESMSDHLPICIMLRVEEFNNG